jgi:hypothetical protein
MRVLLATTVLLGVVLIGFATSGTSAQGQSVQAGITSGEKLSVWFESSRSGEDCTAIEVRGDFLGCRRASQPAVECWYNLRLVTRIERPATQP